MTLEGNSQQDTEQANILILGIGNILLSDEGAGVKAVWKLQRDYEMPPGVEVLDGGTSGMELLSTIESRVRLYILDAINSDEAEPGSVTRIDLSEEPGFFQNKVSPHQLGLSEVLAVTQLTGTQPENIVLYGIRPFSLETGTELTPQAQKGIRTALDLLFQDLGELGLEPKQRNDT
ncbi:MAG: HyaD/HybD family hydrogenase maturation endopeptidase [Desulfohalobiaceae bacterium]|nr:HyaD/HybD family hydrogenase maturation endopeptidase [Desulfohalobiaceae bacterium]